MMNQVNLVKYYFLWELEQEIARCVDYYNNERYQEPLNEGKGGQNGSSEGD